MENHPIPQDITGFQFKLIGDMTIKQFAYLAAGIILGWITFILPLFFLIKLPVSLIFIGLGVAAAFLPIEGRPFDVMISNYFKALFSPTQYLYQKTGGHIWFPEPIKQAQQAADSQNAKTNEESSQKLKEFLKTLPQRPKNKLDEKEMNFLNSLGLSASTTQMPVVNNDNAYQKLTLAPPIDAKTMAKNTEVELKRALEEAKLAEKAKAGSMMYEAAHEKVLDLEKLLSETASQKQALENQILELKKKMEMQNQKVFTPGTITPIEQTQTVRSIPKQMGKVVGLPFIPDVPNLIMGIIKDPRGNPLPNILVEVKDGSGNPVRAFKTNVLGQFVSATPLGNGTFTVSFEDPKNQNKFDTIEVEATGEALLPLEIITLDSREELRRSLFNKTQQVS